MVNRDCFLKKNPIIIKNIECVIEMIFITTHVEIQAGAFKFYK